MKVVSCVLFACVAVGCSHITVNSVRSTYSDAAGKLDVSCATFPASDGADVNSKLKGLYDQGWKLATTGSNGADLFLCFERPISMADAPRPRPRAKPAAAPPPLPAASDDSSTSSDDAPKPARAPRRRPALDGDDSSAAPAAASDDSDSDSPPPKSKRHRPTSSDD